MAGLQVSAATVGSSLGVSQKLKIELPYDLAISLLGICVKKQKHYLKNYVYRQARCSIIHSSQDMETTPVSVSERVD